MRRHPGKRPSGVLDRDDTYPLGRDREADDSLSVRSPSVLDAEPGHARLRRPGVGGNDCARLQARSTWYVLSARLVGLPACGRWSVVAARKQEVDHGCTDLFSRQTAIITRAEAASPNSATDAERRTRKFCRSDRFSGSGTRRLGNSVGLNPGSRYRTGSVGADRQGVKSILLVVSATITALGAATVSTAVAGQRECGSSSSVAGGIYGYAGHEANAVASGVRATITPLSLPQAATGHVAAWVGVGGQRAGPNGTDEWVQAGLASLSDGSLFVYEEISRGSGAPAIHPIRTDVAVGIPHRLAVAAMTSRPGWWRVWVDGAAVGAPVRLAGSRNGWRPIATTESFSLVAKTCNSFAFRFDRVDVLRTAGGGWHPFVSEHRFLDRGYALEQIRTGGTRASFGFVARSI